MPLKVQWKVLFRHFLWGPLSMSKQTSQRNIHQSGIYIQSVNICMYMSCRMIHRGRLKINDICQTLRVTTSLSINRFIYEGKSVNRSQMDWNMWWYFQTWKKKHLFLYIFSTDIDTCVQIRSIEICRILKTVTWSVVICDFRTFLKEFLDAVVNRFTRQTLPFVNRNFFLWMPFALSPFAYKKCTT
jgi:hypothetical protein